MWIRLTATYYQLQDDLNYIHGKHSLKAGISLIDRRFRFPTVNNDKGAFTFNGQYSNACPTGDKSCVGPSGTGLPFADYLMGATSQNLLTIAAAPYAAYSLYKGFYLQDSWRVMRKLTLNYGLRYRAFDPWMMPRNTTLTYNPATGNPIYALQNPLDYLSPQYCYGACAPLNPGVPRSAYKTGNLDLGPRAGLPMK